MKVWKKAIPLGMALAIAIPTAAWATDDVQIGQAPMEQGTKWQQKMDIQKQAFKGMHGDERLLTIVEQYAPDLKDDFTAVLDERRVMKEQLKAIAESKRETMKQKKESTRDLLQKAKNGEITREQFVEQMKQRAEQMYDRKDAILERGVDWKQQTEAHKEANKAVHDQLKAAVKAGDEAQIREALTALLEQMKETNARIQARLDSINNNDQ